MPAPRPPSWSPCACFASSAWFSSAALPAMRHGWDPRQPDLLPSCRHKRSPGFQMQRQSRCSRGLPLWPRGSRRVGRWELQQSLVKQQFGGNPARAAMLRASTPNTAGVPFCIPPATHAVCGRDAAARSAGDHLAHAQREGVWPKPQPLTPAHQTTGCMKVCRCRKLQWGEERVHGMFSSGSGTPPRTR